MKPKLLVSTAALALFAMSGAAFATSVTATTDLNVRAGPGPEHQVIGMIGAGQSTTLNGCLESSKWCIVATNAGEGWVYSDYLTRDFGGRQVVVTERPIDSGVVSVSRPLNSRPLNRGGGDAGAVAGGATGAVAGAIVGGPVGAVVGGAAGVVAGGTTGTIIDPPERVRTYVTSNELEPVYLEDDLTTGAYLPDTVAIREIPDYEYRYVYVNDQPVLVDPGTRRIVYVMR